MMGRGRHTMIDGRRQYPTGQNGLWWIMRDCVESIGMTIIDGPRVYIPTPGTMVGAVVLAESHMMIHINRDDVQVDVYSCKEYDVPQLTRFIVTRLGLNPYRVHTIARGFAVEP